MAEEIVGPGLSIIGLMEIGLRQYTLKGGGEVGAGAGTGLNGVSAIVRSPLLVDCNSFQSLGEWSTVRMRYRQGINKLNSHSFGRHVLVLDWLSTRFCEMNRVQESV